jgi:hypothetical protein
MTRSLTLRRQHGQAVIETMLWTWTLILLIAAAYQVHRINQSIFSSITAAHYLVFQKAYQRNCYQDSAQCKYTSDKNNTNPSAARVIWRPNVMPEVNIPVLNMFRSYALESDLRISSDRYTSERSCPGKPCKATKVGSGAYLGPWEGLLDVYGNLVDANYYNGVGQYYLSLIQGISF